jgi:2-phosphosulfolactate phosphatase
MPRSVVIDCFPESARRYREAYAVVAVDVIRATTTAVTAVETGRRCFPVPSIEAALPLAARLRDPVLVGELGGNMPYGFDLTNSPVAVQALDSDLERPMILLSSSGTRLIHNARSAPALYVGCLRNVSALVRHIAERHGRVAVIGAGTRGEFRDEDQLGCARIAEGLLAAGYRAEDEQTAEMVERWSGAPVERILDGNSAKYLRRSGQEDDLEFVLAHVDDLDAPHMMKHGEIVRVVSD